MSLPLQAPLNTWQCYVCLEVSYGGSTAGSQNLGVGTAAHYHSPCPHLKPESQGYGTRSALAGALVIHGCCPSRRHPCSVPGTSHRCTTTIRDASSSTHPRLFHCFCFRSASYQSLAGRIVHATGIPSKTYGHSPHKFCTMIF